ncbi:MAG: aminoglycoside 6-adenylyltransferase [Defluviitaleaceae bacterium]|nr:aminoglycoside 6-adenylyltransferase [Defluviitaleaceae bacterium]MCL2274675.1 aminoglycoside 6-adenylyltransferase [Defluviitaleaceae bacterium]MCL2275764.1 aminoglycoside 6-adenylyltransferase [Defluviitaleaceae bacterium]
MTTIEKILAIANADERIRGVMLSGSRANPDAPVDEYQDYDVSFAVTDIVPFYNNPAWFEAQFGKPAIMQMPELLRGAANDGNFFYLALFPDGVRIDLSFTFDEPYIDDGEPVRVLLDKDGGRGFFPPIKVDEKYWHDKPPTALCYRSSTSNFWWCLQNVAKGINRDELPYAMEMLHEVRSCLQEMLVWYIGVQHGFNLSAGKYGKYFKRHLPAPMYAQYAATFCMNDYYDLWEGMKTMCDLFHTAAVAVGAHFSYEYRQDEEDAIRQHLHTIRTKFIEGVDKV